MYGSSLYVFLAMMSTIGSAAITIDYIQISVNSVHAAQIPYPIPIPCRPHKECHPVVSSETEPKRQNNLAMHFLKDFAHTLCTLRSITTILLPL